MKYTSDSTGHGAKHSGHAAKGKYTAGSDEDDARLAVQGDWNPDDFNLHGEYKQGPTETSGTGKCNEVGS